MAEGSAFDKQSTHKGDTSRKVSAVSVRSLLSRITTQSSTNLAEGTWCPDYSSSKKDPFLLRRQTDFIEHNLLADLKLDDLAEAQPWHYHQDTHRPIVSGSEWYQWWLGQQVSTLSEAMLSLLPASGEKEVGGAFASLWKSIADLLANSEKNVTIDEIILHLQKDRLLQQQHDEERNRQIKGLVLGIIGWQTMLFRVDFGSTPASYLAIKEETTQHDRRSHLELRLFHTMSREPLYKCLLGFGVLLPPRNCSLSTVTEHQKAFSNVREISSSDLNGSLLVQVGRVTIKWTSCLPCHLEFDTTENCLYLFRYPSFCAINRRRSITSALGQTAIYACAQSTSGDSIWATKEEVSELMEEILMSYRLLFGQHKKSRQLFRNLQPFEGIPYHAQDKMLLELCGRKRNQVDLRADRKHWDLKHDFPMLRARLSTLFYEMSSKKARSWSELWNDKRDSAQWATFWTILIFGTIGLFFQLIQVTLQTIQITQKK